MDSARRRRFRALFWVALVWSLVIIAGGCSPDMTLTIGRSGEQQAEAERSSTGVESVPAASSHTAQQLGNTQQNAFLTGSYVAQIRTAPASELTISSIDLTASIVEIGSTVEDDEWIWPVPTDAVAHHLGTANPGEPGNVVLSGHVATETGDAVFASLPDVAVGDMIVLRSASGEFVYEVESSLVVPPSSTSVLLQVPHEQLTLITCVPDGIYQERLIIRAKRV